LAVSPVAYATSTLAALFVRHFPKDEQGVFPPEALPVEARQAILKDVRARGFQITQKILRLKKQDDDELF